MKFILMCITFFAELTFFTLLFSFFKVRIPGARAGIHLERWVVGYDSEFGGLVDALVEIDWACWGRPHWIGSRCRVGHPGLGWTSSSSLKIWESRFERRREGIFFVCKLQKTKKSKQKSLSAKKKKRRGPARSADRSASPFGWGSEPRNGDKRSWTRGERQRNINFK